MENVENQGVLVPYERLSLEALNGLIDEFILREGTDYGVQEISLEAKQRQIMGQIEKNRVVVVFDPKEDSCSLVRIEDVPDKLRHGRNN